MSKSPNSHDSIEQLGVLLDRLTYIIEVMKITEISNQSTASEIMCHDSHSFMHEIVIHLEKIMPNDMKSELALVAWRLSVQIWHKLLTMRSCTEALHCIYILWLCWACLIHSVEPEYIGYTEFHPESLNYVESLNIHMPDVMPSEANLDAVISIAQLELEKLSHS